MVTNGGDDVIPTQKPKLRNSNKGNGADQRVMSGESVWFVVISMAMTTLGHVSMTCLDGDQRR